jgi:hypothetical protein
MYVVQREMEGRWVDIGRPYEFFEHALEVFHGHLATYYLKKEYLRLYDEGVDLHEDGVLMYYNPMMDWVHFGEEMIREWAYKLWELAGRPESDGLEFWHQAERDISNWTERGNGIEYFGLGWNSVTHRPYVLHKKIVESKVNWKEGF